MLSPQVVILDTRIRPAKRINFLIGEGVRRNPIGSRRVCGLMHELILFDLDGTLCNPLEGAGRCINHALAECGFEPVTSERVAAFIGPPLDTAFESITGSDSLALIDQLIEKYRERYSDLGYAECHLYPGVRDELIDLREAGVPLAVCTSKRTDFAERILRRFELAQLFSFIDGGEVRLSKQEQIRRLRERGSIPESTLMIGDRAVDLVAAHRNGLASAGVLWGYGSRAELEVEKPAHLFHAPADWRILASRGLPNTPLHVS